MLPALSALMSALSGSGCRQQQGDRGHYLTGLTIAALHPFQVKPGFLHARANRGRANGFDRGDVAMPQQADWQHTGANRLTVDVDCTGTALRDAATELRPRHAEDIAQYP